MRFLQLLWRRYTLLCILVLTSLPLTVIGWIGKDTVYKEYALDPAREPGLSLVLAGVHDGIYPVRSPIELGKRKREADPEAEEEVPSGQVTVRV